MNTKNMPGFTAEASLYKTQECYRMTGNRYDLIKGGGQVLPQRMKVPRFGPFLMCGQNGFCQVCEENVHGQVICT
jgi:hypothetical protein